MVNKQIFEVKFGAWSFISAALMLLVGWILMPHHIGEYIVYEDFQSIGENVWFWIWMYRIHIFGWVTMAIALMALMSMVSHNSYRVLFVTGIGMTIAGTIVLALANAYYYNHGAWGVGQTAGMSPDEINAFMENLLFTNQYITCLIRFGRIFSGVGLVILGIGFELGKTFSRGLNIFTIILGLAAMSIILLIPDNFEIYKPLFYIKVLWLLTIGVVLLVKGIRVTEALD